MPDPGRNRNKENIRRTLQRGAGWFASMIAVAILLTACGGGGGPSPFTPAASLGGRIIFTPDVPLGDPPSDAFDGPVPPGIRYGARIVDPGDDIGGTPVPRPNTLVATGEYEFEELDPNPLSYLNLRFTVNEDLEGSQATRTSVSFNIPISLARGIASLLSAEIHRPSDHVLQITYNYRGPDGSRRISARIDFSTDLITFDLDMDGLYDDLIAVDTNHDSVPDAHTDLMASLDYGLAKTVYGPVNLTGSNTLTISGIDYEIWGHTNVMHAATDEPVSLAEASVGTGARMNYVPFSGRNIAVSIKLEPSPSDPQGTLNVRRDGVIEMMDETSILVGELLFRNYEEADISDVLGGEVQPDTLEVGMYVSVTGVHDGSAVYATEIMVKDVFPPPAYIERQGTIEALVPEENPTLMRVDGIDFEIRPQTVIKDLSGAVIDKSYLMVGHPVYVLAHEAGGAFISDVIELRYTINEDLLNPEVVVLYDDEADLAAIETITGGYATDVPIAAVLVGNIDQTDPPCIRDAYNELFLNDLILEGLTGVVDGYPRVVDDSCVVLMLIEYGFEDGYNDPRFWIDYFFPNGFGGAPVEYDTVLREAPYGAGQNVQEALDAENELRALLDPLDSVVLVYTSSDLDFSG